MLADVVSLSVYDCPFVLAEIAEFIGDTSLRTESLRQVNELLATGAEDVIEAARSIGMYSAAAIGLAAATHGCTLFRVRGVVESHSPLIPSSFVRATPTTTAVMKELSEPRLDTTSVPSTDDSVSDFLDSLRALKERISRSIAAIRHRQQPALDLGDSSSPTTLRQFYERMRLLETFRLPVSHIGGAASTMSRHNAIVQEIIDLNRRVAAVDKYRETFSVVKLLSSHMRGLRAGLEDVEPPLSSGEVSVQAIERLVTSWEKTIGDEIDHFIVRYGAEEEVTYLPERFSIHEDASSVSDAPKSLPRPRQV